MGFPGMLKNWWLHHACNFQLYIILDLAYILCGFNASFFSLCISYHQGLCLLVTWKAFEEYGHLHPGCMTCFPLGGERKDRPSSSDDPPGTLHLQPGLSCCPVLAAQMCSDCMDTACKRRVAADKCIGFSRAERN